MDDAYKVRSAEYTDELKPRGAEHREHAAGNALLVDRNGQVRKLPVPSQNPNDPLNFSQWEKLGIIVACCWFSVMSLAMSGGLGPVIGTFFQMYTHEGISSNQIVWLMTFPSLFIGIGNYLILPLSLVLGRRPVFIVSTVFLLCATIGSAAQNSFHAHLAMRIVQGLATGATESLLPLMLTDITFLHQRGKIFGWYWATQNALSSALNLAGSYETAALGWRWFYWIYVIAIAAGLVLVLFGGFETRFKRPATSLDGQVVVTDEFGVTRVLSEAEAQAYIGSAAGDVDADDDASQPKKSYVQMLKPWSGVSANPGRTVLLAYLHMVESLTSPGILYATLLSSIVLACSIGMSLSYDAVLQSYGWPAKNVGLIAVGGIIGSIFGMAYAAWPSDRFIIWKARRNEGIHRPEHRLLVLVFPLLVGFAALLLYGFTAQGGKSWWGPYLGWTLFQMTFVAILIVTSTFAAEAWPRNPGPAIVVVIGTKNIISFGVAYGLTPMIARMGYGKAYGTLAGIYAGIALLGIPVYLLNPRWRAYMAEKEAKGAAAFVST